MLFGDGLHNISSCIHCSAMRLCHFAQRVNSTSPLCLCGPCDCSAQWNTTEMIGCKLKRTLSLALWLLFPVTRTSRNHCEMCKQPDTAMLWEVQATRKSTGASSIVAQWKSERDSKGPQGIGHGRKAVVLEVDSQFWPHPLVPHGAQPRHLLTVFLMVLQQYATWQLKKKATASIIGFGAEQKLKPRGP